MALIKRLRPEKDNPLLKRRKPSEQSIREPGWVKQENKSVSAKQPLCLAKPVFNLVCYHIVSDLFTQTQWLCE